MQVGDKWEIWIPWMLGYGETGNNSIPGYTTLVFEIELLEIVEQ
jgi:FKBP-type peptidyl-prolyl cis-trans isomerase